MKFAIDLTAVDSSAHELKARNFFAQLDTYVKAGPINISLVLVASAGSLPFLRQFENDYVTCLEFPAKTETAQNWFSSGVARLKRLFSSYPETGILKRNNIKAIVCCQPSLVFSGQGIPVVSIVHDLGYLSLPHYFSEVDLTQKNHLWTQLKNNGSFFLCPTTYAYDRAVTALGLPKNKTTFIPIGCMPVAHNSTESKNNSVLEKFNRLKKKYLLYPADVESASNHKLLLTAFNIFKRKHTHCEVSLVLVGKQISSLQHASECTGLGNSIFLIDELPEGELFSLMKNAYAVIFPSLYEDTPFRLMQVMACKKPVLASNVACIPEVVGDAALYFDPRKPEEIVECIRAILEDCSTYERLETNALKRAENSDFPVALGACVAFLSSVMGNNASGDQFEVSGLFDDGWASESISISFGDSKRSRKLKLSLYMPEAQPHAHVSISVKGILDKSKKISLQKNESIELQAMLPRSQGKVTVRISESFIPGGVDTRRLGVMFRSLMIIDAETGEVIYDFGK